MSQVWTDKALTNEVSRKATYQDMLKQDGTYEADVKNRDTIKTSIDLKEIHSIWTASGFNAHSEPMNDEVADAYILKLNAKYPHMFHWTVRVFEANP